ncbi:MAG: tetratricopeptide repeat protein [Pseudomonadota bacterium]
MAMAGMVHTLDPFGNALTLQQPDSAEAVHGFLHGFLGYKPSILAVLPAAEQDHSLVVQACAAALWMFSESPSGPPKAHAHLETARRAGLPASDREQRFAAAIAAWVDGDIGAALALHAALAHDHPRDLAAIKLGQYHAFNLGDAPTLLKLALPGVAAAPEVPAVHGLAAFGWEQCHRLDLAETAARRALAMLPAEAWAQHALAHVLLTDGRLAEGAYLLHQVSAPWQGLTSFMRCHLWWHLALFHIELGEDAAALALYDKQVWGVDKSYSQDQVGAVSLLARLELAGVAVADRWDELAGHLVCRVHDQVQPFLDLQYLYGLARAGRPEAEALLAAIEAHAPQAPPAQRTAWQQVAVPAARGLLAHARGQWAAAADGLGQALPRLALIGGSHAQRDLFEQLHIDALGRAGQLAAVQNLLQPRANAQPQSQRLKRRLHEVCAALGLPALAR